MDIVVAELTSNLVKHTKGGYFLAKKISGINKGIEIICIDNGPGMASTGKMMEDGVSTVNTMGQGLGAIKRLSDEFDIYSIKDWGSILLARIYNSKPKPSSKNEHLVNIVMVPKEGEKACGDACGFEVNGNYLKIAVSDGLGHGKEAEQAALKSLESFEEHIMLSPKEQLKKIHEAIKKMRGAVMNITHIDFDNNQLVYCGVGNISSRLQSPGKSKSCISYNGIVGHSIPTTLNNHVYQWSKNDMLVITSDGLNNRWDILKYPSITKHDGSILAAALYKDHFRGNDDVTVAIIGQPKRTE